MCIRDSLHQNTNGNQNTNTERSRANGVGSLSLRTCPAPKSIGLVGDATLGCLGFRARPGLCSSYSSRNRYSALSD
eukprot:11978908-Alexandrium_andersonii.AAC.1